MVAYTGRPSVDAAVRVAGKRDGGEGALAIALPIADTGGNCASFAPPKTAVLETAIGFGAGRGTSEKRSAEVFGAAEKA